MTVTGSDVQMLLDSSERGATMVLEEGRVQVFSEADLARDPSPLVLVSRDDLVARLDSNPPTEADMRRQAAMLDEVAGSLGA
ncbi:hypothetical protein G4X40_12820 [Rhodococcus sp. D2-41]|uniref:Uncharacterized protein n=1 Tax=Speluncibacter jeojiensis TaxID=2710754 RepID=A0A9X4LZA8_9ACTN|nr:hypothetical protein [Rhodococcus sp. D2-41]MDG3011034.1 hypothetical protein [Rhodococcus sp. D2-41]MDG3014009.1 hypothetical protein [Corynebacteriales bacterium D3-21]